MSRIQEARIIIFGLGGVGSWAAEALVRTGFRHLTLVDADCVATSNINRQLLATTATIGRSKVEVMRERLLEIDPEADIAIRHERYSPATSSSFALQDYDYAIDAIDSLADKAHLILQATSTPSLTFFSSMGAALKTDPTRVEVAEFWKVEGCPLAAALRHRFKREGVRPRRKFRCVFSPELVKMRWEGEDTDGGMSYGKARINGALCQVTATFGMTLASLVYRHICEKFS